jgi:hypothetical protein
LVPQAEQEANFEDNQMALKARLLSKVCRNITPLMKKHGTTVIFISQVRANIGSMSPDKSQASSPKSIRFYCSIRIKCTVGEPFKDRSGQQIGMTSRLKTVKNKLVAPGRVRLAKIIFGKGYQVEEEWIEYATLYGVIEKKGAGWFVMPNGERVQGLPNLVEKIQADPILKKSVLAETKKRMDEEKEAPMIIGDVTSDGKTVRIVEEAEPDDGPEPVGVTTQPLVKSPDVSVAVDLAGPDQDFIDAALALQVIETKAAGWFVLPNGKKVQGYKTLISMVSTDLVFKAEIESAMASGKPLLPNGLPEETGLDEELDLPDDIEVEA